MMSDERLCKFFHFTEDDLAANRLGEFSDSQKRRLAATARTEQKSARESSTILFVVAAVGLALGLSLASIAPTLSGRIFFGFVLCTLWTGAWGGRGVKILRAASALKEPRVLEVSGRASIRSSNDEFILQIGDVQFDLNENPSGVLAEADEYTVYYLEATQEILSITHQ